MLVCKDPMFSLQAQHDLWSAVAEQLPEQPQSPWNPQSFSTWSQWNAKWSHTNGHQNKWHQESCSFYMDWYYNISPQQQMQMPFP